MLSVAAVQIRKAPAVEPGGYAPAQARANHGERETAE